MSNLSPAAIALEADLCLLTRLPLPKEADLDAIKERVFGSVEGVPRTEDESRWRYVDAIVQAFDAAGVYRIEQLPEEVRRLVKKVGAVSAERDRLMAALHKLEDSYGARTRERDDALANIDRLLEANKRHVAERDEARSEVRRLQSIIDEQDTEHDDVSDDLRRVREEYDALREKYEALNADHRDFILARRRANDLESEGNRLRTENANLTDAAPALTTERDRLAARVREHEETLAVLSNVNADLFRAQQDLASTRAAHATLAKQVDGLTYERDKAVTALEDMGERESIARADAVHCHQEMRILRADLTRALNRVEELQAETVEQENRYNHMALVVVDLLKGRGVE